MKVKFTILKLRRPLLITFAFKTAILCDSYNNVLINQTLDNTKHFVMPVIIMYLSIQILLQEDLNEADQNIENATPNTNSAEASTSEIEPTDIDSNIKEVPIPSNSQQEVAPPIASDNINENTHKEVAPKEDASHDDIDHPVCKTDTNDPNENDSKSKIDTAVKAANKITEAIVVVKGTLCKLGLFALNEGYPFLSLALMCFLIFKALRSR